MTLTLIQFHEGGARGVAADEGDGFRRGNYLWLAHSKLRPKLRQAAPRPALLVGELPTHVSGTSRILRDGATSWQAPFLSGEANMSHSIANLEHHHFKYAQFRRPGDVHVHFLRHRDPVVQRRCARGARRGVRGVRIALPAARRQSAGGGDRCGPDGGTYAVTPIGRRVMVEPSED